MSTRHSRPGGSELPTEWSQWEWNAVWKCESRYRQVAASGDDAIEYEYRDPKAPRGHSDSLAPATLSTIEESPNSQETYATVNYTYNVNNVTEGLSRTGLREDEETSQSTTSGQKRPTSAGRSSNYYSQQQFVNSSTPRYIHNNDAIVDTKLNPEFKVHESWEFKFGRVFKVLWSEPTGSTGTVITGVVKKAKHGEYAYHSIRRFVIVSPREGHCICLPILTYGGQGTLKKGVHASDHAVIYTGKSPTLKGKERITKRAIRMVPSDPRHKLDSASRINYAKLYTVEHNVKVQFIGSIAQKYEQQVVTDYNATHQPLPDRPYYPGTSDENTFGHAQGLDPRYSAQSTSSSWPATTTSAAYYSQPSVYAPTATTYSPYANPAQPNYHSSTSDYYTHAGYPSNETYSPQQSFATPAEGTETEGTYAAGEYQHPASADAPTEAQGNTETPHYEEGLYEE